MVSGNIPEEQKVPAELKRRWVEALRSGEFYQCRGKLRRTEGYCCLGVLLKVAGFTDEQIGDAGTLSQVNADLARMLRSDADEDESYLCKLERMNDGTEGERRHSFSEIADYIEKTL